MFKIEGCIEGWGLYSGQHDAIYGGEVLQAGKRSTARQRRDVTMAKTRKLFGADVREVV
jgi:hypothetical protein